MNSLSLASILLLLFGILVDAQYTCSPTQPCEIGCCTKFGSCGLGPESCGPTNCISNCDRKSECDPGWGSEWSSKQTCPLNVCCSKYGFCGTTSEFCGNPTVSTPSCSGSSSSKRTIGYYESWAIGRRCDRMYPERIPIGSYTHLNFAFAFIVSTSMLAREIISNVICTAPNYICNSTYESFRSRTLHSIHFTEKYQPWSPDLDLNWWLVNERA